MTWPLSRRKLTEHFRSPAQNAGCQHVKRSVALT
jgi:hypothetical protein